MSKTEPSNNSAHGVNRWLFCSVQTSPITGQITSQMPPKNYTVCLWINTASDFHQCINSPFTSSCSRCFTKHRAPALDPDSNSRLTPQQHKTSKCPSSFIHYYFCHCMLEITKSHFCPQRPDTATNTGSQTDSHQHASKTAFQCMQTIGFCLTGFLFPELLWAEPDPSTKNLWRRFSIGQVTWCPTNSIRTLKSTQTTTPLPGLFLTWFIDSHHSVWAHSPTPSLSFNAHKST